MPSVVINAWRSSMALAKLGNIWAANIILGGLYAVLGYLGLKLAVPPGYATLVWPAAGLAMGAIVLFGPRLIPGVLLGSFAVNAVIGGAVSPGGVEWTALGVPFVIAMGSSLQCVIGWAGAKKAFGRPLHFKSVFQLIGFAAFVGPVACLVAATVGVGALMVAGIVSPDQAAGNWVTWWTGDVLGVVLVAPLVILAPWGMTVVKWSGEALPSFSVPALLAILVPLGLTGYVWQYANQAQYARGADAFESIALDHEHSLMARLESYLQALDGAAGLMSASNWNSLEEWRTYVDTLDISRSLPGINGIGFIDQVPDQNIGSFLSIARAYGVENLTIHPDTEAPANFIIRFIEPIETNVEAVGLNIAFETNRYQAAVEARDTGRPIITKRILLVQDDTKSPGFLLLRPFYQPGMPVRTIDQRRQAFKGWVYSPFVANNFMANLTTSQGTTLDVHIFDGSGSEPDRLIYSSDNTMAPNPDSQFTIERTTSIYGQTWTVVWTSTPQFEASAASGEATLAVIGGLILTALLAFYLYGMSRREEGVRQLVAHKTREIAASERRWKDAVDNAPIGMALIDLEGHWLKANEAIAKFFGYTQEEFLALDHKASVYPEDADLDAEQRQQLLSGEISAYQIEKRYVHRDGQIIWGHLSASLARDAYGKPAYFIAQLLDVNDRKEMDRIKHEFVSNVSHELRTPLTSIRGSLGLITGAMADALPDNVMHLLRIAHKNSERLIALINDILDLEKLAADKIEFDIKRQDLVEIVQQSVEANLGYASDFDIDLQAGGCTSPVFAEVDANRLIQVLSNLISNAVKFSDAGGTVDVCVETEGETARLLVKDRGRGIPAAFRSRIFTPFSQADASATREKGGTGLGLHITRQFVERMGGTIDFESEEGTGTTFVISLPRVEAAGLAKTAAEGLPKAIHVEDDTDFCSFLTTALESELNIVHASSKAEALELIDDDVDMLILDIGLPDGSGLDLLDQLPESWKGSVIAVTASEDAAHPRFDAVLIKSKHREEEVISAISDVARHHMKMAS